MAEGIIQKAGGGAASDECTAAKAQVLAGYTAVTSDSNDEPAAGTMVNQGAKTAALDCEGSYTIPAGYHNGSGRVTANSLASQTGGATATDAYVRQGYTYWKDGVKRTGAMTVSSVVSFSVAAYSTSQVLCTWKNPAKGPYSGFAICAKTGGYPTGIGDSRVYTGAGNNPALNAANSVTVGGLAAGQVYYFRVWAYCQTSAGDVYSGYQQAAATPTAHGRQVFTASGTFTVPAGVRSINIHCTGGGGRGGNQSSNMSYSGGGGGYTSYKNGIAVSPGQQIPMTVGAGGFKDSASGSISGGTSSAGSYVSAAGGAASGNGGSGGGAPVMRKNNNSVTIYRDGLAGGSDGNDGGRYSTYSNDKAGGTGQHVTTKEFGTGTLYSGGGGSEATPSSGQQKQGGPGGAGGGGAGAGWQTSAADGSAGSGGGGGGKTPSGVNLPGAGGSGNIIVTW